MKRRILFLFLIFSSIGAFAQTDSLLKIHHAEPLYTDLIRDLGARKGERELNVGFGVGNNPNYVAYSGFAEYEFSPANRLGLEVEIPFTFYQSTLDENTLEELPRHRIEGLKLASQYTFWVSAKYQLSMAAGYMNEVKFHSFKTISDSKSFLKGNVYSPFFIVAKRWGMNMHSLVYTGPVLIQDFSTNTVETGMQFNMSMHYMFSGTSNFVGVELNHEFSGNTSATIIRPQAKVKAGKGLFVGVVSGIPVTLDAKHLSFMLRLIYEPSKKQKRRL